MAFIQKDIQDIFRKLALKHNISVKSVSDIVESEFEFVADEMKKGEIGNEAGFSTILLKYLGTFRFSKSKHYIIGKTIQNKNEKHTGELQQSE